MTSLRNKLIRLLVLLSTSFVAATSLATAQVKVTEPNRDSGQPNEIIEMTVSAAPQTNPIFKHRLTYPPSETKPGNAATIYMHLLASGYLSKVRKLEEEYGDEVYSWSYYDTPRDQIPVDKLREASAQFDSDIKLYLDRASRLKSCDWGYQIEELTGPISIELALNSLQDTRSIARIIALQTKLAILESRLDDAINLMRMNYRLARNTGQAKLLVGSLVALAEVGITNGSMLDLIAAPNSPNMYWALTELPRPIVDVREAIRTEVEIGMRIFPEIASAETANHSKEEWSRIVQGMPRAAFEMSMPADDAKYNQALEFLSAGIGLLSYAPAKQRLIASGMDAEKVEQMAVGQVLLIDANREYRRLADMLEASIYLPFQSSDKRSGELEDLMKQNETSGIDSFGKIIAGLLLPAAQQVRSAQVRVQRNTDALRVIEALRMHAAETGKFPAALDEVTVAFIPNNPATRKPFEYRLEGDVAVLELPKSDGVRYAKRYRISLR